MLKTFINRSRPYTIFDASNAEHRKAYYHFMTTKSWDDCKFRFVLEDTYLDVPSNLNNKMVEYYAKNEFEKA